MTGARSDQDFLKDVLSGGPATAPGSASKGSALAGREVLVVDDNPINLDIAIEALQSAGAHVKSAEGGADAIELLKRFKFELVLLDLSMPGIDGMEVGRVMRSSELNATTRLLIFTASDTGDANRAVRELKAQGVVPKPVDIDNLLKKAATLF